MKKIKLIGTLAGVIIVALAALQIVSGGALFQANSESRNTQVINSITRTEEVSLLSLGIQGISEQSGNSTILGFALPGSSRQTFIQYGFQAKLGINGADVIISEVAENHLKISIPQFIFIGHSDETFKLVTENNGVLSWVTPEVDQVAMVNEILNDDAQLEYIDTNKDLLKDQAQNFYTSIIKGIDPEFEIDFVFND